MPPKKPPKQSSTTQFLDSVREVEIGGPDELTPAQLLSAYGLARPSSPQPHTTRLGPSFACPSKFTSHTAPVAASSSTATVVVAGGCSPAASVASSTGSVEVLQFQTDDEVEIVKVKTPKAIKTYKRKGKGKADPTECSAENCNRNPLCTNWLGQSKWEATEDAVQDFYSKIGLGANPTALREEGTPVGLRNLGATCYINSFVQVWFQDVPFLRAVYACTPPAHGNATASPVFQLQVLFASLQRSTQSVYDPEPLVKSLKLDTTEQQDAQEFGKLFLDLLARTASKQQAAAGSTETGSSSSPSAEAVRSIADRFEGRRTWGTRCKTCGTRSERQHKFVELDVSLRHNCKLEQRLAESLEDETLERENQYRCEHCNKLRDAVRYTRLDELPAVMHFSITRFQFDWEEQRRIKFKHSIGYPLRLNMARFLDSDEDVWYELRGVLEHRGDEAVSGHYVAKVLDGPSGKWFTCNDELVTPIEDLNKNDDDDEELILPPSRNRPRKSVERNEEGETRLRSKEAYMLVYTAVDGPKDTGPAPEPPALALAQVQANDAAKRKESDAWEEREAAARAQFHEEREKRRSVYSQFELEQDEGEGYLVNTASLAGWITEPLVQAKKGKAVEKEIDLTGDDDPAVAHSLPGSPKPDERAHGATADQTERQRSTTPTLASSSHNSPPSAPAEVESTVGASLSNKSIMCKHKCADLKKADEMKLISGRSFGALLSLGVTISPELLAPRDLCRECTWIEVSDQAYRIKHKEHVDAFIDVAIDDSAGPESWISAPWLKDWKRERPLMHLPGTLTDPNPTEDEYETHVVCLHGQLQPGKGKTSISPNEAAFLEAIFPGWKRCELIEPCQICSAAEGAAEADAKQTAELKSIERKALQKLGEDQSLLFGLPLMSDMDQFVVPRAWARQWHEWAHSKTSTAAKTRPGVLDNDRFMCEHDKLHLDVAEEIEKGRQIALVPSVAWEFLQANYGAGPEIKIFADRARKAVSVPEVCVECLAQRRRNFSTTKLAVRILTKDDFLPDGSRKRVSSQSSDAGSDSSRAPVTDVSLVERTRSRTRNGAKRVKPTRSIEMTRGDTILDLKVKISHAVPKATTIYQRLWHDEYELTENDATVESVGMGQGSVVELYVWQEGDRKLEGAREGKKSRRTREEGFGGTGLAGEWDDAAADELSSVPEAQEEEADTHGMDVDEIDDPHTPRPRSPVVEPATVKRPNSPSPQEQKPKRNTALVSGSGLFGMKNLEKISHASKRAATEAADRSPSAKKGTPFRSAKQPPTSKAPSSAGRSLRRSSSGSSGPPDIDLTREDGPVEDDSDEDEELQRVLAASRAEAKMSSGGSGEQLTEEEQLARAIALSNQDVRRGEAGEEEGAESVAGGSGQLRCARCTFLNERGVKRCVICDGRL